MCASDELRSIVSGLADLDDLNSATSKILARISALDAKISTPVDTSSSELKTVAHLVYVAWDTGAWHMARSNNAKEREAVLMMCYAMRRLEQALGIVRQNTPPEPPAVRPQDFETPLALPACMGCGKSATRPIPDGALCENCWRIRMMGVLRGGWTPSVWEQPSAGGIDCRSVRGWWRGVCRH